ncbi:MAG TPA: MaoC family dehydratase [Xanthobacteraceae bacterium]
MRYFEDLRVGQRADFGSHTFTADEIKAFARRFDPQPFHVDEEAAARSHFGRLCASGWHTAAVCMRHAVEFGRRADEAQRTRGEPVARSGPSPGVRDLRWLRPIHAGDTISFAGEVTELREMDRPGFGLLVARHTGVNQHGELVYSVEGAVFVERRPLR